MKTTFSLIACIGAISTIAVKREDDGKDNTFAGIKGLQEEIDQHETFKNKFFTDNTKFLSAVDVRKNTYGKKNYKKAEYQEDNKEEGQQEDSNLESNNKEESQPENEQGEKGEYSNDSKIDGRNNNDSNNNEDDETEENDSENIEKKHSKNNQTEENKETAEKEGLKVQNYSEYEKDFKDAKTDVRSNKCRQDKHSGYKRNFNKNAGNTVQIRQDNFETLEKTGRYNNYRNGKQDLSTTVEKTYTTCKKNKDEGLRVKSDTYAKRKGSKKHL